MRPHPRPDETVKSSSTILIGQEYQFHYKYKTLKKTRIFSSPPPKLHAEDPIEMCTILNLRRTQRPILLHIPKVELQVHLLLVTSLRGA